MKEEFERLASVLASIDASLKSIAARRSNGFDGEISKALFECEKCWFRCMQDGTEENLKAHDDAREAFWKTLERRP